MSEENINNSRENHNTYKEFIKEYSNNTYEKNDSQKESYNKNLDDTMSFYCEESVSTSVQKLFNSNDSDSIKIEKLEDESIIESEISTSKSKEDSFFDDISETQSFDFGIKNHKKVKSRFGKVFFNSLTVVFLCITVLLMYKIKLLNKNIDLMELEIKENKNVKKRLEIALNENESMKKIIEELGNQNGDYVQKNMSQTQNLTVAENNIKKYIVQRGDTLSSISQKFYGNKNAYSKIIDNNHLANENLSEGQELIISE